MRSRRSGWVALLVATGVIVGGGYAVRRRRLKRNDPPAATGEPPRPSDADGPAAPRVSRVPVRPAFAVAAAATVLVVIVAVAVFAVRPSERVWTAPADTNAGLAAALRPDSLGTPVETRTAVPAPAGTVEPGSLASDGVHCDADTASPALNTVHPVLTARVSGSEPANVEIKELGADMFVSIDADDLTSTDGLVVLYFRGYSRLKPGASYRWRIRGTAADDWSPWCAFSIAAATVDSLGLGADRFLTAGLPPLRWRDIAGVLGPGWPHGDTPWYRSIQAAGEQVSAGDAPVSLRGWDWETVLEAMAEWASARNDPELWRLVDTLSTKLGGPPHPTLGFPRA